jgi:stage II sporulation protein M
VEQYAGSEKTTTMTASDGVPRSGSSGSRLAILGELHRQARYTRWLRWYLVAALAVFFGSAFAGYALLDAIPVESLEGLMPADSPFPDLPDSKIDQALFIMFNNLRVLVIVLLGTVTLGLLSLFSLFVNGLVVGAVVAVVAQQTSWVVILAALVPHGIIELPAFFVASAISFRVTHRAIRYGLGYDETLLTTVERFELVVYAVVLVAMIVAAAWIEIYVTPGVIEQAGGLESSPLGE